MVNAVVDVALKRICGVCPDVLLDAPSKPGRVPVDNPVMTPPGELSIAWKWFSSNPTMIRKQLSFVP